MGYERLFGSGGCLLLVASLEGKLRRASGGDWRRTLGRSVADLLAPGSPDELVRSDVPRGLERVPFTLIEGGP